MVSTTPPIRPIQFSTLKALNSLDQQQQHAERHDRQGDEEQVLHGTLLGIRAEPFYWNAPKSRRAAPKRDPCGPGMIPNRIHAGRPSWALRRRRPAPPQGHGG